MKLISSAGMFLLGLALVLIGLVLLPITLILRTIRERSENKFIVLGHEVLGPLIWVGLSMLIHARHLVED